MNSLLLDTNVLLLWLVAQSEPLIVYEFKRVSNFNEDDCVLIQAAVAKFTRYVTTPHVLSESSNFLDQAPAPWRRILMDAFRAFLADAVEIHEPALQLSQRSEFNSFGLTDTALVKLSRETTVLTVDFRLSGKIASVGGKTINFNHLRLSSLSA